MKIAVAGTGYVGLSIATLLSQHHEVMAVDIIPEKVDLINHMIAVWTMCRTRSIQEIYFVEISTYRPCVHRMSARMKIHKWEKHA